MENKIVRRILAVAAVAFVIGLGADTVYRSGPHRFGDRTWGSKAHRTDFTVYREAGLAVWDGTDPTDAHNARNWLFMSMPVVAIAMAPFAMVNVFWGSLIWYGLSVLMVWGSARWAARLARQAIPACAVSEYWLTVLAIVLTLPITMSAIVRGQPSLLVMFLVTGSVACYLQKRDWLAGFCLMAAITIKAFPALLMGYFLLKGRFRMVIATAVWSVVLLLIAPSVVFGVRENARFLYKWTERLVLNAYSYEAKQGTFRDTFDGQITRNQSVRASVTRLFLWGEDTAANANIGGRVAFAINLALLAATAWVCRKGNGMPGQPLTALQLCGVIPLMLFVSPLTWNHYFAVLAIPLTVGAALALTKADTRTQRLFQWGVGGWLVLSVFSLTTRFVRTFDALLVAALLLWGAFIFLLARDGKGSTPSLV